MTAPTESRADSSVALAASARMVQVAVRARLLQDVARLWPVLDPKRLNETFPGWLRAMMLLLRNYHGQSAAAASVFYRKARADAILSPTPRALIKLAPAPAEEWMARALGYAGPGLLERDTVKPQTALATTLGTSARIVLDGGRRTVLDTAQADPVAVGWYRVTDGDPCAFCALMAARPVIGGRGAIYQNEQTAGRNADARFTGSGQFKFHNNCGCSVAPMFSRDQGMPEVNQQAAEVYLNRGKGDALNAFRRAWESRNS